MTCSSGSVQSVADKTVKAKEQIDKLQNMLKSQEEKNKALFYQQMDQHLKDSKISDAREIGYNSDIKTEYVSEFSLDKIASVVVSTLKALEKVKDPSVKSPATSPEAIDAYVDVVNTVAQAAKSSATSSSSLSFSMNRLSPGMYAFLYASSANIKDEDTFGTEAVTSTAIYYRIIESIEDVKNEASFQKTLIDANNLLNMKTLQAGLTDSLKKGEITIDVWMKMDQSYSEAIKRIEDRLSNDHFNAENSLKVMRAQDFQTAFQHMVAERSKINTKIVHDGIHKLSSMGDLYKGVIETCKERLESNYF